MDFFYKKELNSLKGDIKATENAIEAEKVIFKRQLINYLGPELLDYLNNPYKTNWFLKLKIKYQRWRENKKYKKIIKNMGF